MFGAQGIRTMPGDAVRQLALGPPCRCVVPPCRTMEVRAVIAEGELRASHAKTHRSPVPTP